MTQKASKSVASKPKATKKAASNATSAEKPTKKAAGGGAAGVAAEIIADERAAQRIAEQAQLLLEGAPTAATQAARVLDEIAKQKIELVVPILPELTKAIFSKHKRVAQMAADALPQLARVAPARVARHLDALKGGFAAASPEGKDGLVRTFSALCVASVAYQKKLEPVLAEALEGADGKTLAGWCPVVLPALKGEPHARARAVVEARLDRIPRATAQEIADFLGIRLRARYR